MRGKTIINDTKTKIKELNWLNPFLREFYFQSIERSQNNIIEIKKKIKNSKNDYEKSRLSAQLFNEISSTLINANNETVEYKKILNTGFHKRLKKWWNKRLYELHQYKCHKYIQYRESKWNDKYKAPHQKANKEFNQYRKFAEKERSNKKFKQLNDLFGSDINGFWREVKKMQKLKQLINVPLK